MKIVARSWLLALVLPGCGAAAPALTNAGPVTANGIELVETAPIETTLDHADVANAADVWVAMIDRAQRTLDFAEFYASEDEPQNVGASKLAPVLAAIERAAGRHVHVRFLVDAQFAPKYPETLERLKQSGVELRILDFGAYGGGVLHAKYFVVDGAEAFLGSQNFDWRALAHIQEIGVRLSAPVLAGALLDIFDTDWALASGERGRHGDRVRRHPLADVVMSTGETVSLVASPRSWLPDESSWELPKLVALLDGAKTAIDLQVLTYKTTERDSAAPFPTLDDALRRAAARGVHVRLVVSDWSSKPGSEGRRALDALAAVPNVAIRIITIPPWSGGDIPFARVAHAKYLVVDAARAWIGTSNWEAGYFTKSRNVGVVVSGGQLPARLDGVFTGDWTSAYVTALGSAAPPSSSGSAPP